MLELEGNTTRSERQWAEAEASSSHQRARSVLVDLKDICSIIRRTISCPIYYDVDQRCLPCSMHCMNLSAGVWELFFCMVIRVSFI